MFNLTKSQLSERANELNFVRDTLEKALRLVDILSYINANKLTRDSLALKGGTAINLLIFDLPRLSVDIDLDFDKDQTREEMLASKELITSDLTTYLTTQGYSLKSQKRSSHSLEPLIFSYQNMGGVNDNIKIEINYSLRAHLFPPARKVVTPLLQAEAGQILCLEPIEIFAAKINALLSRAAPRDLYDVFNMIRLDIFKSEDLPFLRKAVIFYKAISQPRASTPFDFNQIDRITQRELRTELFPVIQKIGRVDIAEMRSSVKSFLTELLQPTHDEQLFLESFSKYSYHPEYLFDDEEIVERIRNHPIAVWKMQGKL